MHNGHFARAFTDLRGRVIRTVYGKDDVVDRALICLLAGGHLLLDDVPGVGKTTLARALAGLLADGTVSRIQGTPDLLPGDITGTSVYEPSTRTFSFRPGPVIANIVLFDEINRCSPRTQSALLEAMQERRVHVFRHREDLPEPFMVIGTQNPQETLGTYPLPEAQLDRFLMRLTLGYPGREAAVRMLKAHGVRPRAYAQEAQPAPEAGLPAQVLLAMAEEAAAVPVDDGVYDYLLGIVEKTREHPSVALGASPRAAVDLLRAARVAAVVRHRPGADLYLQIEDVRDLAADVLAHRLVLTSTSGLATAGAQREVIRDITRNLPLPRRPLRAARP